MDSTELREAAKVEASERLADHPWTERIAEWLENSSPAKDFTTSREIFIDALGGMDKTFDRRSQLAIGAIMRRAGWRVTVKRFGERLVRGYTNTAESPADGGPMDDVQVDIFEGLI